MSVAGFEEASESAIRLQVEDGLIVRVGIDSGSHRSETDRLGASPE